MKIFKKEKLSNGRRHIYVCGIKVASYGGKMQPVVTHNHYGNNTDMSILWQMQRVARLHYETFAPFKNINAGRDVVIIATGPSLNNFKPIKNAVYIGVNRAFAYDKVKLDYLFMQDYTGLRQYIEESVPYKNKKLVRFYGIEPAGVIDNFVIPESVAVRHNALRYYCHASCAKTPELPDTFAYDLCAEELYAKGSTVFCALQFALWTNPKRIYLVGCDCSNAGHFDGTNNNDMSELVVPWAKLKSFANIYYPETEIISVNPVGLRGLFSDLDQVKPKPEPRPAQQTQPNVAHDIGDIDTFLLKNKIERMDANRDDLFDKTRCLFHLDRYRFACEFTQDKVVLDCASGTGYGADMMSHLGRAKQVFGLEVDADACAYAKQVYSSQTVHFTNGSILDIPFDDEKFDVFTSFETIEHIENEAKQLSEVKRVLKKGGLYILSTPNDWASNTKNPFHVRAYTYESLVKSIGAEFKILAVYNQNSGTPNRPANHDQPRGIIKTTPQNHHLAECFIVVAKKI